LADRLNPHKRFNPASHLKTTMKYLQIESDQAILIKSKTPTARNPWMVCWRQGTLYQQTENLNRNDGKRFLKLLRKTLKGDFFHQVKGNLIVKFPV
jgi:predicted ribosome quality control (RQC) complex YloA/Tae2 family protein